MLPGPAVPGCRQLSFFPFPVGRPMSAGCIFDSIKGFPKVSLSLGFLVLTDNIWVISLKLWAAHVFKTLKGMWTESRDRRVMTPLALSPLSHRASHVWSAGCSD